MYDQMILKILVGVTDPTYFNGGFINARTFDEIQELKISEYQ